MTQDQRQHYFRDLLLRNPGARAMYGDPKEPGAICSISLPQKECAVIQHGRVIRMFVDGVAVDPEMEPHKQRAIEIVAQQASR